jgi:hypothetical protein
MKLLRSSASDIAGRLLRGALLGCCLAAGGPLLRAGAAQEEPELVTDRPDQTESTAIVPVGRVQIELGASLAGDEIGDDQNEIEIDARQLGATLVRTGLSRRFELRLGWEGWLDEEVDSVSERESEDGAGDAVIGAKVKLREGNGLSPAIAVLVHSSVPIGDAAFTTDRFDSSFRLAVSHDLEGGIGLGYNVGVETESSDEGRGHSTLATAIYTLSAGIPAGERLGFFIEAFGEIGLSADGPPAHSLDTGVTYLLRPNLQLDAAAGVGVSEAAGDWFAGIGVSVRLPR